MYFFFLLLYFLAEEIWCDYRLNSEKNQSLKAYCGTKPSHQGKFDRRPIAGGREISGKEAPWAVYIQYPSSWCSATMISPRHILSASHCLMKNSAEFSESLKRLRRECDGNDLILYPDNNEFSVKNSYGALLSDRVFKIVFSNYCYPQATFRYDDMMIWELKESIQLDDYAFPACISNNLEFQSLDTEVRVTAYGHNSWDFHNSDGKGTSLLRDGTFRIIGGFKEGRFIAISGDKWADQIRPGDSGGSVIHYVNGQYYTIGSISTASQTDFYSEATSVYAHYSQICHHTGIC
ncbi:hypothetical protein L3Y34_005081 [Caenorhabditis briggsae]|uniref:Peptidase S1 domain-containing protein n=1 Tax=Caenorhabditis briggsae TaxID=6238 RepID=A0AAE9D726_CAEBR|nr:hypothetical protein L3Y34_005081 [Caenorhabditis briggsae]